MSDWKPGWGRGEKEGCPYVWIGVGKVFLSYWPKDSTGEGRSIALDTPNWFRCVTWVFGGRRKK